MLLFLSRRFIGGGELDVERAGKGMEIAAASGVGEKEVPWNREEVTGGRKTYKTLPSFAPIGAL